MWPEMEREEVEVEPVEGEAPDIAVVDGRPRGRADGRCDTGILVHCHGWDCWQHRGRSRPWRMTPLSM